MKRFLFSPKHEDFVNLDFQIHGFGDDRERYRFFKEGKLTSFDYGNDVGFNILMILEKLGFSVDEIGTYTYKDLIKEVIYMINDNVDEKEIVNNLMNTYSQLYVEVARNTGTCAGAKTLHNYIDEAFSNRDMDKVDKRLQSNILGDFHIFNYGIYAYFIANYINNSFNLYRDDTRNNAKTRVLVGK